MRGPAPATLRLRERLLPASQVLTREHDSNAADDSPHASAEMGEVARQQEVRPGHDRAEKDGAVLLREPWIVGDLEVGGLVRQHDDGRDAFLVFRNATTEKIRVLFRRADGDLVLREPAC